MPITSCKINLLFRKVLYLARDLPIQRNMRSIKNLKWLPVVLLAVFFLSSCAAGDTRFDLETAGFWAGLWHGFISLVTFIISLFNDNVTIYEVNNTGWPYNLGFILGAMIFYGGGSKGTCKRRK
jgi:hypothetical protein